MHLSPVLSRFRSMVLDQSRHFNWTRKKQQINQLSRNFLKNVSWKSPKIIGGLSILTLLTGGLTYYLSTTTSAAAVIINGQQIGLVSDIKAGKNLVETTLKEQGKPFGLIAKTNDQITYKNVRVKPTVYFKSAIDEKDLEDKLNSYFDGYELKVNNSDVAFLPNQDDVDKVLKEYQDYYVKPSDDNKVASVNFAEKVDIQEADVQPVQMEQVNQALKILLSGKSTTTNYTVHPNDSWWLIARKNNMLTDEVLAGNPGATKDTKLQPGQIIKLINVTPYLTVVSQGTYTGRETIPFDIETETNYNLASGQTAVVKHGSSGSKLVTYSYVQKNGIDTRRTVLNEKVIKPPVTEVIAKGPSNSPLTIAFAASRGGSGSSNVVDRALSFVGDRYVFGGTNQSGFDCSGFTKYVFAGFGISLPRTSYEQFASGVPVSMDNLRPGDLVFFTTYSQGASHVGIYIGGGRFVQASNPYSGVDIASLSDSFYSSRYLGARRYD